MPIPSTGTIYMGSLNVEVGNNRTSPFSMNALKVRKLLEKTGDFTTIRASDGRGKSWVLSKSIVITTNQNNVNIKSVLGSAFDSDRPLDVTFTINSGVVISSTSTASYALQTGSSYASGSKITVFNNGSIVGRGGDGGKGGTGSWDAPISSTSGKNGGPAFLAMVTALINNTGTIGGGGGGGGGGNGVLSVYNSKVTPFKGYSFYGAGGGGGGGGGGSAGGTSGDSSFSYVVTTETNVFKNSGENGNGGSITGSGDGGFGGNAGFTYSVCGGQTGYSSQGWPGQKGGSLGASGSSSTLTNIGGEAGYALVGSSFVTFLNQGTILGKTDQSL
jgi:hypothetical protein